MPKPKNSISTIWPFAISFTSLQTNLQGRKQSILALSQGSKVESLSCSLHAQHSNLQALMRNWTCSALRCPCLCYVSVPLLCCRCATQTSFSNHIGYSLFNWHLMSGIWYLISVICSINWNVVFLSRQHITCVKLLAQKGSVHYFTQRRRWVGR